MPYQDASASIMTPALRAACQKAIHVVRADGHVLRAGRAVVHILAGLGQGRGAWLIRLFGHPPLLWGVELGYWIVARNRRFFARFLFRTDHDR